MNLPVDPSPSCRIKIGLVGVFFFVAFVIVLLRAYQLQVLDNNRVEALAQNQREAKVTVSPRRGAIYDRNGDVLALDVMVSSVGIHPAQIHDEDKTKLKEALLKNTNSTAALLDEKLNSSKKFEYVERRIPWDAGRAIEKQKLPGVQVVNEYRRYYPNKELAGQLLGAVGYDAKALGGVELSFDDYLLVAPEKTKVMRDARGRVFSDINERETSYDITLTIDKNVQHFAEQALAEYGEKHAAQSGFAIVVDVSNGEILAMANYPSFNPNLYWQYPPAVWKNHAIIDQFEPGSTFKTISMAAGLQTKKIKPTDKFFCENGSYRVGSAIVNDHNGYGWLDAREILKVSSNIGITKIAMKVGKKDLYDTIKSFGYGSRSELGLVGEAGGSIRPVKSWIDIELSNISFGQGISVTGLQMARAYAAIANGGDLYGLSLIKKIINSDGEAVFKNEAKPLRRVLDTGVAQELRNMLFNVTQPGGTARTANIEGYKAGGKTGTAQKFDYAARTYASHEYTASFVGFTPLENPRFVVAVVFDAPHKGYYGGIVAAPAFKQIAEKTMEHYGIAPAREPSIAGVEEPDRPDVPALASDMTASLRASFQQSIMPDLRGLSLRQVMTVAQSNGVSLDLEGSGVVVEQTPQAGSALEKNGTMKVRLAGR